MKPEVKRFKEAVPTIELSKLGSIDDVNVFRTLITNRNHRKTLLDQIVDFRERQHGVGPNELKAAISNTKGVFRFLRGIKASDKLTDEVLAAQLGALQRVAQYVNRVEEDKPLDEEEAKQLAAEIVSETRKDRGSEQKDAESTPTDDHAEATEPDLPDSVGITGGAAADVEADKEDASNDTTNVEQPAEPQSASVPVVDGEEVSPGSAEEKTENRGFDKNKKPDIEDAEFSEVPPPHTLRAEVEPTEEGVTAEQSKKDGNDTDIALATASTEEVPSGPTRRENWSEKDAQYRELHERLTELKGEREAAEKAYLDGFRGYYTSIAEAKMFSIEGLRRLASRASSRGRELPPELQAQKLAFNEVSRRHARTLKALLERRTELRQEEAQEKNINRETRFDFAHERTKARLSGWYLIDGEKKVHAIEKEVLQGVEQGKIAAQLSRVVEKFNALPKSVRLIGSATLGTTIGIATGGLGAVPRALGRFFFGVTAGAATGAVVRKGVDALYGNRIAKRERDEKLSEASLKQHFDVTDIGSRRTEGLRNAMERKDSLERQRTWVPSAAGTAAAVGVAGLAGYATATDAAEVPQDGGAPKIAPLPDGDPQTGVDTDDVVVASSSGAEGGVPQPTGAREINLSSLGIDGSAPDEAPAPQAEAGAASNPAKAPADAEGGGAQQTVVPEQTPPPKPLSEATGAGGTGVATPESGAISTPAMPPEYTVQSGDNLWNIVEGDVAGREMSPSLEQFPENQRNAALTELFRRVDASPELRQSIGLSRESASLIYPDEKLNIAALDAELDKMKAEGWTPSSKSAAPASAETPQKEPVAADVFGKPSTPVFEKLDPIDDPIQDLQPFSQQPENAPVAPPIGGASTVDAIDNPLADLQAGAAEPAPSAPGAASKVGAAAAATEQAPLPRHTEIGGRTEVRVGPDGQESRTYRVQGTNPDQVAVMAGGLERAGFTPADGTASESAALPEATAAPEDLNAEISPVLSEQVRQVENPGFIERLLGGKTAPQGTFEIIKGLPVERVIEIQGLEDTAEQSAAIKNLGVTEKGWEAWMQKIADLQGERTINIETGMTLSEYLARIVNPK